MFERFTKRARSTVVRAQEEARALRHEGIGTEHLLLAVVREPEEAGAATLARLGVTAENCRDAVAALASGPEPLGPEDAAALRAFGIDLEEVRRHTDAAFEPGALDRAGDDAAASGRRGRWLPLGRGRRSRGGEAEPAGHIPFTPRAKKALELALREAVARKDRYIGVEHLVLALLRSDDRVTRGVLARLGIEPAPVREIVLADLRDAA
ncbi:Clp protease [Streptomyces sp. JJ36]|nr:Clp protease [Streptomyces sp. JJ36]